MAIIKSINLDEETFALWNEKFGDSREASVWVRETLKEEKAKQTDPTALLYQLGKQQALKQEIEANIVSIQNKLTIAREKKLAEQQKKEAEIRTFDQSKDFEIELDASLKLIKTLDQYNFKVNFEGALLISLATEYTKLKHPKPLMYDFLISKGYEPVVVPKSRMAIKEIPVDTLINNLMGGRNDN